jgi:hypothetical protein
MEGRYIYPHKIQLFQNPKPIKIDPKLAAALPK